MKRMHALCFLLFAAIALASGQIPRSLSYQGVLTDTNGVPKPDGQYIFTFRLYETSTGGSPVGMQQQTLNVRRGLLHTALDQILASLNVDRPYWLGIQVGGDPELSPRIPLTSVPYSLTSSRADTARYAISAPQQAIVDSARIAGTIPSNAVSTAKLQDGAVTSAKISDGAIQRVDVAANFKAPRADTADYALVGTMSGGAGGDLSGSYPNPAIAANAVTSGKIQDGAIANADIADNAITSNKISDGSVSTADIADNSVTTTKILNGTIQFSDIGQNGASAGQVMKWNGSSWVPGNDSSASAGPWQMNGSAAYYSGGNVGIGTTTPTAIMETQTGINQYSYAHTNGTIRLATFLNSGFNSGMIGTTSNHPFQIYTSNSGPVMTFSTGGIAGNVGIGTVAPSYKLDVSGSDIVRARINSNFNAGLALTLNGQPGWSLATVGSGQFQIYNDAIGQNAFWIDQTNNNVGIGTNAPAERLRVVSADNINTTNIVTFQAANLTQGIGFGWDEIRKTGSNVNSQLVINAKGTGNLLLQTVATGNVGIGTTTPSYKLHSVNTTTINDDPAVYGEHAVTDYWGVGVKGVGLYKGVEGMVSTSGAQIYYGVRGEVSQSGAGGSKYGVYGTVTGTGAGTKYGLYGTVDGAAAGTKVAVGGEVNGGVGIGVSGSVTANDVNSVGVYGYAQPLGRAVYANGNLVVSGAKLFQIDHPLDPANKMLNHYCTEGPEPLNVYSGTASLDGTGAAWITLPEYFQSINKDFRYQLTPIGASMPELYVAEEVQGNRFKIGGGKSGMKVSWQVSATRNDLYIQRAGITAEVEKTGEERGKYLVPELFGQPETMGIFWRDRSAPKDKSNDTK